MLLILISDLQSEQDIQGYESSLYKQNSEITVLLFYDIYLGILENTTVFLHQFTDEKCLFWAWWGT